MFVFLPVLTFLEAVPSVVKTAIFFGIWILFWLPVAWPVSKYIGWPFLAAPPPDRKIPLLASLYLVAVPIVWGTIHIEQHPFSDYGVRGDVALFVSLGMGVVVALASLLVSFGIQWMGGWIRWVQFPPVQVWLPAGGLALWVAATEELIFRGILLNWWRQDWGLWGAAIATSAIFALLHGVWERRQVLPQLPGLWLLGMVLVLARLADGGSLGLAWGLHAGWVWGLAALQSGEAIAYTGKVPSWVTGIAQQPLAGVVGIVLLIVLGLGLYGLAFPEAASNIF
ncbi:CPBP family intramembrane glutamic endopeptidase [Geitlerinema sp. PCC 9228]|uniref:CPBP family intramembrane glutamic endopeptidase n=1 Tax=Geitlerinema sp. PCC 9228 TaxID=111611 RepID=UPI0008F9C84C|nr:CPBP family intramembrane glutamic endopeptidase [Geitlerinema sp. PCC 9228]